LVSEIGVQSDQGIELTFGQLEELAVLFASPTRFLGGPALVPKLFLETAPGHLAHTRQSKLSSKLRYETTTGFFDGRNRKYPADSWILL